MAHLSTRGWLILGHDLVVTILAILGAFYLRFETAGLAWRADVLVVFAPLFGLYAGLVYTLFNLYRGKWRFASLPDLYNIFRAVTVLALSLLVLDYILVAPNVYGGFFFGKITIVLYWLLQMFLLGGPRIAYRFFRHSRTRHRAEQEERASVLAIGNAADADVLLRAIESGAARKIRVVALLSPSAADQGQSLRGVPVVGRPDDLEQVVADYELRGIRITRLVLTASALAAEARPEATLMRARRLGILASRLPSLEAGEPVRLAPVAVEDLLLRPSVAIDYHRVEASVRGKAAIVTGGGGSIGAEICRRLVSFGAVRLLVVDNSEPALHAIIEEIAQGTGCQVAGHIGDVRDRRRMFRLFEGFDPDLVFHAAALKHVPILERDWEEGIRTNVLGSVNVADAAAAAGATAMVMISTDKAIEPVSMLGATKRFAEMYCQALDADFRSEPTTARAPMRLIAVRFGNVLASNGSVVPKFRQQIEAGGPVTVTHPDMVRYFMTIREACDLVLTAGSHAIGQERSDVSVYVLNMGQPVRILDLAERMIRLSGLEPGVDIDIAFTGMRPGERLHEILFAREEPVAAIGIEGIVAAKPVFPSMSRMRAWLTALDDALIRDDRAGAVAILCEVVPDFRRAEEAVGNDA